MNDSDNRLYLKRPDYFRIAGKGAEINTVGFNNTLIIKKDMIYCKSKAGILFNDREPETDCFKLNSGSKITLPGLSITFMKDVLIIKGALNGFSTTLLHIRSEEKPFESFPLYKRSPRVIKVTDKETVELKNPIDKRSEGKKRGILRYILPSLLMLLGSFAVCFLMKNIIFIFMSLITTGTTVVISVVDFVSNRNENKGDDAIREKAYNNYLLKKRKEIYKLYNRERKVFDYSFPRLGEIENMVRKFSPRIYERSSHDEDFLKISLGSVEEDTEFSIKFENDDFMVSPDPLYAKAERLKDEYRKIKRPVVVDLKKAHLGLVGEPHIVHNQLKSVIMQLAFFHSYRDIRIVALYNEVDKEHFLWMRWLPHCKLQSVNCTGLIDTESKRDQILGTLNQILKERNGILSESHKESMFRPHIIFIIDNPKLIIDHSIMEYIGRRGFDLGFSVIYTSPTRAELPENIGTVVEYKNSDEALLIIEERKEKDKRFGIQSLNVDRLEWTARDLGILEHQKDAGSHIPESITFFGMYGVKGPAEMNIPERWRKHDSSKSLAVPLGARAENDYVYLNLHEKAHGPHGLIAGTTGSGKSELVQSYILSLAVNFSPYEVAFLLIDYKGGGMAGLFNRLPHLLGTITNLDGTESLRAMASIKAELSRRQEIFNKFHVNHINSYNKLFRSGDAKEPLPHLFIISDEFAELKKEQPEFMSELVSTARIGRSLGVHLILATQKPAGVVDDQIWSNSKFKIALKVQNASDSNEVLKTPDAANITQTGRAYLQVGNNEIYELFQSAWSGAQVVDESDADVKDNRVYVINDLGQGELINPDLSAIEDDKNKIVKTELDVTVDYIHDYYQGLNAIPVTRPWLPPLGDIIKSPVEIIDAHGNLANLTIDFGLVDIPEKQEQIPYTVNLATDGNVLFVAAAGFGKTVFLTTATLSLAMKNSVDMLNIYLLDFGNSGLIPLKNLNHVSDYIGLDDKERINKFVNIMNSEMADRKKKLAVSAVQSFEVYNKVVEPEKRMKAIVIMLDNIDALHELDYLDDDFMNRLTRDGQGLGIYFIVSATRGSALKYQLANNFKNKICGYVIDDSDVNSLVGKTDYKMSEVKGRAFVKIKDNISFMQVYSMCESKNEIEYTKAIEKLVSDINSLYPDEKAPSIPVLPEELTDENFAEFVENAYTKKDIYLGLNKSEVLPSGMMRNDTPFLILGEAKKGKTNVLRLILNQLLEKFADDAKLYLFDSKEMELFSYRADKHVNYYGEDNAGEFVSEFENIVTERENKLKEALLNDGSESPKQIAYRFSPVYLLVDELSDFAKYFDGSDYEDDVPDLIKRGSGVCVTMIFTANSAKVNSYDDIAKTIIHTTEGLMLGEQGALSTFPLESFKAAPKFPDGLLWHNGNYERIRVPKVIN